MAKKICPTTAASSRGNEWAYYWHRGKALVPLERNGRDFDSYSNSPYDPHCPSCRIDQLLGALWRFTIWETMLTIAPGPFMLISSFTTGGFRAPPPILRCAAPMVGGCGIWRIIRTSLTSAGFQPQSAAKCKIRASYATWVILLTKDSHGG